MVNFGGVDVENDLLPATVVLVGQIMLERDGSRQLRRSLMLL